MARPAAAPSMARSSVAVAGLSGVAMLLSLLSQILIARAFGTSGALDAYLLASSLPFLAAGALGGVFAYAAVPALTAAQAGVDDTRDADTAFLLALSLVAGGITAVGCLFTPILLSLLPSSHLAASRGDLVAISRLMWTVVGLGVVVGALGSIANTAGVFVAPVLAGLLPYLGIATLVLASAPRGPIVIALGMLVGTAAATVLLSIGSAPRLRFSRRAIGGLPSALRVLRNAPAALLASVVFSVYPAIDALLAPHVGVGVLSTLAYCQRILIAAASIVATGPSVVLQPMLARFQQRGEHREFDDAVAAALRLVVAIAGPVAIWLALHAGPVTRVLLERGSFTAIETARVESLLPWMLLGMVPMAAVVMMYKALFALHDVRTTLATGLSGPVVYFVGAASLTLLLGARGFGAAYCLTWYSMALGCWWRLSRRGQAPSLRPRAIFPTSVVAALAAALVLAAALRWGLLAQWRALSGPGLLAVLAASGTLFLAGIGLVSLRLIPVGDLRTAISAMRSRQATS